MSTRAQATSVVAAARFPPQGIRGFGNPFTQLTWGPGVSATDYLARANDAVLVLVQIETRGGVDNLDDILAVDGLGECPTPSLPGAPVGLGAGCVQQLEGVFGVRCV